MTPEDLKQIYEISKKAATDAYNELFGAVMLNKTEAAKYLKISRPTLDKYIIEGIVDIDEKTMKLPFSRLVAFNFKNKKSSTGKVPLQNIKF